MARNALFIGEHVGAPVVELTGAGTDSLRLSADPPVVGVRAWAVEDTLRPVPVSDDGEGNLTLTVGEAGPEPLDLIVLAGGHQIAVLDALGNVLIDQPEPHDTGTPGRIQVRPLGQPPAPARSQPVAAPPTACSVPWGCSSRCSPLFAAAPGVAPRDDPPPNPRCSCAHAGHRPVGLQPRRSVRRGHVHRQRGRRLRGL